MLTPRLILALAALVVSGCLDIGYQARSPAPRDGGTRATIDGCVEGPADPAAAQVLLQFSALDVDQHLAMVRQGEVVAWINASSAVHTATAGAPGADVGVAAGGFDSGRISSGGSWAHRFCDPRTLEWYCQTHPAQMRGYRIVIQ